MNKKNTPFKPVFTKVSLSDFTNTLLKLYNLLKTSLTKFYFYILAYFLYLKKIILF